MKNRKLTKEEKTLCEKQVVRHKEKVINVEGDLDYNKALMEKQKYLRDFDDKWRSFLRKRKDEDDKNVIKEIKSRIKNSKEHIKMLSTQLTDGVEEKTYIN